MINEQLNYKCAHMLPNNAMHAHCMNAQGFWENYAKKWNLQSNCLIYLEGNGKKSDLITTSNDTNSLN